MKARHLSTVALSLLLSLFVTAQENLPEYGAQSELKDHHKVYITTGEGAFNESRSLIVGVIKKYKELEIVNSPDDADLFLIYSVAASTENRGRQTSHYMRSNLTAYVLTDKHRRRILWSDDETYEESSGLSFSRPNEMNLAMHFIKAVKQARGEKK